MPQHLLPVSALHHHNTRSSANNNYTLPSARINLKKTSFAYRGPDIWNSIPTEIRSTSHRCFKKLYKKHLLEISA